MNQLNEKSVVDGEEKFVIVDTGDTSSNPKSKLVPSSQISKTGHTHSASDITDFDTEVSNNSDVAANKSKLSGIESGADVTDSENVNSAGATMNSDTDVSANNWVLDEDDMASNSNTKVPTQQSVKSYVQNIIGYGVYSGDIEVAGVSALSDTVTSTSYEKMRDIEVALAGTYKVEYTTVNVSGSPKTIYSRIYVDGVAVGTEQSSTGTNPSERQYSTDITVTAGQNIQIYGKTEASGGLKIKDFKIKANILPTAVTGTVVL